MIDMCQDLCSEKGLCFILLLFQLMPACAVVLTDCLLVLHAFNVCGWQVMIIVMVMVVWNLGLDSDRMLFTQACGSHSSHSISQ